MIDSRRSFFINSAKIGLGASIFSGMPLSAISSLRKYVSPNEKINFGLIGCKGMGWADMKSILKKRIAKNKITLLKPSMIAPRFGF